MCGFGDSWIKGNTSESADSFPFNSEIERVKQPPALIIFIKNPEKGKVKTRLAGDIGEDEALKWYGHMLNHTRETVLQVDAERYLFYSQAINDSDDWSPENFSKHVQPTGDLGDRMATAFKLAFDNGHPQVVIVGSDCLDLRVHHLKEAFDQLHQHDFVLGPANDGGYYLLGMNSFRPEVFQNIAWSTEEVFPETVRIIQEMGRTVGALEELTDIDYESDLRASLRRQGKED